MALKIVRKTEVTKTEETKKIELTPEVALKDMYFRHEGSDSAVLVKKGESLSFLSNDIFDEITKAEYVKLIKDSTAKDEKESLQSIAKVDKNLPSGIAAALKYMAGKKVKRTTVNAQGKPMKFANAEYATVEGELIVSRNNMTFRYQNSKGTTVLASSHLEHGVRVDAGVQFPGYDQSKIIYHL